MLLAHLAALQAGQRQQQRRLSAADDLALHIACPAALLPLFNAAGGPTMVATTVEHLCQEGERGSPHLSITVAGVLGETEPVKQLCRRQPCALQLVSRGLAARLAGLADAAVAGLHPSMISGQDFARTTAVLTRAALAAFEGVVQAAAANAAGLEPPAAAPLRAAQERLQQALGCAEPLVYPNGPYWHGPWSSPAAHQAVAELAALLCEVTEPAGAAGPPAQEVDGQKVCME
ncbi:hypothetical protein ABPG75_002160 [Micractinium tetrahymenae]